MKSLIWDGYGGGGGGGGGGSAREFLTEQMLDAHFQEALCVIFLIQPDHKEVTRGLRAVLAHYHSSVRDILALVPGYELEDDQCDHLVYGHVGDLLDALELREQYTPEKPAVAVVSPFGRTAITSLSPDPKRFNLECHALMTRLAKAPASKVVLDDDDWADVEAALKDFRVWKIGQVLKSSAAAITKAVGGKLIEEAVKKGVAKVP